MVFDARPKNPWWPEAAAFSSFCRGESSGSGRRQGSEYEVMGHDKGVPLIGRRQADKGQELQIPQRASPPV